MTLISTVAVAATALVLGTSAQAGTLTFSDNSATANTLSVDQFDPLNGTLTSVGVEYFIESEKIRSGFGTTFCDNFPGFPPDCFVEQGRASATATVSISGPGVSDSNLFTDNAVCTPLQFDGAMCSADAFANALILNTLTLTDPLILADYIGTDSVDFLISFDETLIVSELTVVYTFDDPNVVPLPAGAVLLLTGFGGFAALRRRRARS